jgi:hypothetical protein
VQRNGGMSFIIFYIRFLACVLILGDSKFQPTQSKNHHRQMG